MARWKLVASHYLTVEGTAWESIEVDQMSGKQIRKRYPVPLQLDIADPTLWNDNIVRNPRGEVLGGDIVVAHKDGEHNANDYLFTGNPTPDMFPLDEEAKAASAKLTEGWKMAPDEELSYGRRLVDRVQEEQAAIEAKESTVKVEGLSEILGGMSELLKQNAALIATLTSAKSDNRRL